MSEANMAVEFDEPVQMDSDGQICDEKDSVGLIFTQRMTHTDYFTEADELGGNISQKGDENAGHTRLLCEKGSAPKRIISNQENTLPY